MSIIKAYVSAHPPLAVPAVGRGAERQIETTLAAYRRVAREVAELKPTLIIFISPHAPFYRDGFYLAGGRKAHGSFARFGCRQLRLQVKLDKEAAGCLKEHGEREGIPLLPQAEGVELDHATLVPLYYIQEQSQDFDCLILGVSGLSLREHERLGRVIRDVTEELGRRSVLIASGDLSHCLKETGPYGFRREGPLYDRQICEIFRRGALGELFEMPEPFRETAGECGHRSFAVMAAAIGKNPAAAELYSYEAPFGVGYAIAAFTPEAAVSRTTSPTVGNAETMETAQTGETTQTAERAASACDPFLALARYSIESYVRGQAAARGKSGEAKRKQGGKKSPETGGKDTPERSCKNSPEAILAAFEAEAPSRLPDEFYRERAACFVSLHRHGDLRGCIGSIMATRANLALEIVANAIAAATEDPRFAALRVHELRDLELSVDVLGPLEEIESEAELDPQRYGVIVSRGWQRGLLLPRLEGVDSVREQLDIARRKAGIPPAAAVRLQRFEVTRHEEPKP